MANHTSQSWLRETLSKFTPIGTAVIFSPWLLVIYWYITDYSLRLSEKDLEIIGSFIEWFGTAYSLFLALVLANAWNQYDTLDREFDQELDAITALYDNVKFIEDPRQPDTAEPSAVADLCNSIKSYISHVINNYLREGKFAQQRRNGDMILEGIGREIRSLAGQEKSPLPEPIASELFDSLNTAIDVRGDRISHSKQRIPQTVWYVAVISSILWLIPFLVLRIDDLAVRSIMKVGIAFIIVIVLTIISDLDNPFEGTWKIGLEAWDDFLRRIECSPQLIFAFNVKNDLVDQFKNLTGEKTCKLSSFSRMGLFGISWRRMLKSISSRIPDGKLINTLVYSDQFGDYGYSKRIQVPSFPSVVLKRGDTFTELMTTRDINECPDLTKFEEKLAQKLRENTVDLLADHQMTSRRPPEVTAQDS